MPIDSDSIVYVLTTSISSLILLFCLTYHDYTLRVLLFALWPTFKYYSAFNHLDGSLQLGCWGAENAWLENTIPENAGQRYQTTRVENAGPNCMGAKHETGKRGNRLLMESRPYSEE